MRIGMILTISFAQYAPSSAYIKPSFNETCLAVGFNIFHASTPDTCYGRRYISVDVSWAAAWEECVVFGSGPGRKSLTIQPTSLAIQNDVLKKHLSTSRRPTAVGLMFDPPCVLCKADYWGLAPDWVRRQEVSFDGRAAALCNKQNHLSYRTTPVVEQRAALWDKPYTQYDDAHIRHGFHYFENVPITNAGDHVLCQLQSFSRAEGQLMPAASRSEAVLALHRFATLTSPSLGHCSFACIRNGGCFGAAYGDRLCELYRLAPAEMEGEGGWERTMNGLRLYAFDWPRRV